MKRREVLIIRIGLSIESVESSAITVEPSTADEAPTESGQNGNTSSPANAQPPRRFLGRDTQPTEVAYGGDTRGMSDAQKKALFRLAYDLGDKATALELILDTLGVDRLDTATRVQASRAIGILEAQRNGSPRPTNGAGHA